MFEHALDNAKQIFHRVKERWNRIKTKNLSPHLFRILRPIFRIRLNPYESILFSLLTGIITASRYSSITFGSKISFSGRLLPEENRHRAPKEYFSLPYRQVFGREHTRSCVVNTASSSFRREETWKLFARVYSPILKYLFLYI